mmetsp:Transcript_72492/g.172822  ORF Transcript_72492/g.172822 Transcript_72492/m.172822 type:complete len:842 (-) Transcript_72492:159-2684(-)
MTAGMAVVHPGPAAFGVLAGSCTPPSRPSSVVGKRVADTRPVVVAATVDIPRLLGMGMGGIGNSPFAASIGANRPPTRTSTGRSRTEEEPAWVNTDHYQTCSSVVSGCSARHGAILKDDATTRRTATPCRQGSCRPRPASAPRLRQGGGTPPRQAAISRRMPAASRGRAPKARPQGKGPLIQKKKDEAKALHKSDDSICDKDQGVATKAPSPGRVPVPGMLTQAQGVAARSRKPSLHLRQRAAIVERARKVRQSQEWVMPNAKPDEAGQVASPRPAWESDTSSLPVPPSRDRELQRPDTAKPHNAELEASYSSEDSMPQPRSLGIGESLTMPEGMLNYTMRLPGGWPVDEGLESESDCAEEDNNDERIWAPSYLSSEHRQRIQAVLNERRQQGQEWSQSAAESDPVPQDEVVELEEVDESPLEAAGPPQDMPERLATRPPSRGGESWEPLGQTTPPAYESSIPEHYLQFQQLLQNDVGNAAPHAHEGEEVEERHVTQRSSVVPRAHHEDDDDLVGGFRPSPPMAATLRPEESRTTSAAPFADVAVGDEAQRSDDIEPVVRTDVRDVHVDEIEDYVHERPVLRDAVAGDSSFLAETTPVLHHPSPCHERGQPHAGPPDRISPAAPTRVPPAQSSAGRMPVERRLHLFSGQTASATERLSPSSLVSTRVAPTYTSPPSQGTGPNPRVPVERCLHLLADAILEVAAEQQQPPVEPRRLGWQRPAFGEPPLTRFREIERKRKEGEPQLSGKTWNQIRALLEEVFSMSRSPPATETTNFVGSIDSTADITADDRLELLVMEEIYADEASWLDVGGDVEVVKNQVAHLIFSDLVDDTLEEIKRLWPP